jgi:hypothetical protein
MNDSHEEAPSGFDAWAPLVGVWTPTADKAIYEPPTDSETPATGLLIGPEYLLSGVITTEIAVRDVEHENNLPQARIVFGFDTRTNHHYAAGVGGYNSLYVVEQYTPGQGWRPLRVEGNPSNLRVGTWHRLVVEATGQRAMLTVNGVEVLDVALPAPLSAYQIGVTAWGQVPIEFRDFSVAGQSRSAFVVMQFGEPWDTLYRDVIAPVAFDLNYTAIRADDVFGPGVVLHDIIRGIQDAELIIAEITPVNANVFDELGYAHALGKPTILLAKHGLSLPFDVSGFRCIFYDDTIGGKSRVESELRRHLEDVLGVACLHRHGRDIRDFVRVAGDDVRDDLVEDVKPRAEERTRLGGLVDVALPAVDARDRVDDLGGGGEVSVRSVSHRPMLRGWRAPQATSADSMVRVSVQST